MEKKPGCPIGNLAIEMSEHDEIFRMKIQHFFECWIDAVEAILDEMVKKNQQDIQPLINGTNVIRIQYNLF
jgi:TetR/AcrR family transcriptional regulator, transcriptional repressor for nem operon